jgi:Zn-dependent alcohol dehydrogenase
MGHEGCGIVESVGDGVSKVKIGDKVVMHWRVSDGIESEFPQYVLNGKTISSGKVTTLSEFSIVSENRITKIPQDTPADFAALLGCCISTAFGVVNNEANIRIGENVAVFGCGGLGLGLILGANIVGAGRIVGIDIDDEKGLLAKNIGATSYINSAKVDLENSLKETGVSSGFDVVIDTTGIPAVISKGLDLLSNNGRMILVAQPEPGKTIELQNASGFFGTKGKSIISTQGGRTLPHEDIPRYINLFIKGNLDYEKIVTHKVRMEEVNTAVELLKAGQAGRIIVKIGEE